MRSFLTLLLVGLCAFVFSGCASIVSRSSYPVSVQSQPPGLSFSVVDVRTGSIIESGVTPETVTLRAGAGFFKSAHYEVRVMRDGEVVNTLDVRSSVDGWYFGNLVFGGLIGMVFVDPATGAMYKLPKEVTVFAGSDTTSTGPQQIEIRSLDSLSEELKDQLVAFN